MTQRLDFDNYVSSKQRSVDKLTFSHCHISNPKKSLSLLYDPIIRTLDLSGEGILQFTFGCSFGF